MRPTSKSHALILGAAAFGAVALATGAMAETGIQRQSGAQNNRDGRSAGRAAPGALTPAPGRPIVVKGWDPTQTSNSGKRQVVTPPNPPRDNGQWGNQHDRVRQALGWRYDRWDRRRWASDHGRPVHRRFGWFGWW